MGQAQQGIRRVYALKRPGKKKKAAQKIQGVDSSALVTVTLSAFA
jgi:hypothetical protein